MLQSRLRQLRPNLTIKTKKLEVEDHDNTVSINIFFFNVYKNNYLLFFKFKLNSKPSAQSEQRLKALKGGLETETSLVNCNTSTRLCDENHSQYS